MTDNEILMPINDKFIEVFKVFMDDNQRTKIRANNVRQYTEGIVDLILKNKIVPCLKPNEKYEGINWGRKITILQENYDVQIANNIQEIFRIGGDGSHFNGVVSKEDLQKIINEAIHIVEDIFVKYFLEPEHNFGTENIFTIFSMLPLKHRIYILENVSKHYTNLHVVDRLSLAYAKNGEKNKAIDFLKKSLDDGVINKEFYDNKLISINVLVKNLPELYKQNAEYEKGQEHSKAIFSDGLLVVGMPTSRDVFETAKAIQMFDNWFEQEKNKHPEFINLFLYLMQTDNREYE